MATGFLDHMRVVPDHRISGMVTYPLDEILLTTLAGVVCGADDWEGIEEVASGALDWLRAFLPFANGIATAQTLRKVFRLLDPTALERGCRHVVKSVLAHFACRRNRFQDHLQQVATCLPLDDLERPIRPIVATQYPWERRQI